MCGIVSLLSHEPIGSDGLEDTAQRIRIALSRGYDSVGSIALPSGRLLRAAWDEEPAFGQWEGMVEAHREELERSTVVVGHLRWSTHGGKTVANAHPHRAGKLYIVHNGIICNYESVLRGLRRRGRASETDTEVAVMLMSEMEHPEVLDALAAATERLDGTWAFVLVHADEPDRFYLARRGSPLLLGTDGGRVFCGSDPSVVAGMKAAISIPENMVARIRSDGRRFFCKQPGSGEVPLRALLRREATVPCRSRLVLPSLGNHRHWTEKEIEEQPEAALNALNQGARLEPRFRLGGLDAKRDALRGVERLIFCATGSSMHAAMFAHDAFKRLFRDVRVICASELNVSLDVGPGAAVVFVSQSGETYDCLQVLAELGQSPHRPVVTIGVVNAPASSLARATDCGVYINAGPEVAVAATKSFTGQVVALHLVAGWFAELHGRSLDSVRRRLLLVPSMLQVQIPRLRRAAEELLPFVKGQRSLMVLGSGPSLGVAREGALKIKELSYQHAEGFGGGSLKHGPLSLLEEGTPVFIHVWAGCRFQRRLRSAAEEVRVRGAFVVVITNVPEPFSAADRRVLITADTAILAPLGACVFFQWLSYLMALQNGANPDQPRSLAKSVTVE